MTDWIPDAIASGGYPAIFLLMALENIFPPIPSELIMGLGGVGVGEGRFSAPALVAVGSLGSLLGNYMWFMIGRRWCEDDLRGFVSRHGRWLTLDVASVDRIDRIFETRGQWVVLVARFIPNIRTLISVPAGLFGMSHAKFIVATLIGSAIWNSALVFAGYELQQNVARIEGYLGVASWGVVAFLVLGYLFRVATWQPRAD